MTESPWTAEIRTPADGKAHMVHVTSEAKVYLDGVLLYEPKVLVDPLIGELMDFVAYERSLTAEEIALEYRYAPTNIRVERPKRKAWWRW